MGMRTNSKGAAASAIGVASTGVGFKPEHAEDIFGARAQVDFFEIHAENYMGAGGPPHHLLRQIRESYPLSIHGVGLSIGGMEALDQVHLRRLKRLVDTYRPALFSEHLAWSSHDGVFFNDLLPLPYNKVSLAHVCAHIDEVQSAIGMRMLLENPSTYITYKCTTMSETEFLDEIVRKTGCGLLLDVSNVEVSAVNHGFDALAYIDAFPIEYVGEIHLAGYAGDRDAAGAPLLIDDHGQEVSEKVWALYRRLLVRGCTAPTLIEWDNNVPSFPVLAKEAARARSLQLSSVASSARKTAA
jgi:uncharacterized protein (UPF0276 family)